MWQQQCLQMADEARRYPSVVHLGNLVELCESGRLRGSGGCGSLLAPRLADGSMRAVMECTPEQLTRIQRSEPRLVQSLTIIHIEEPSSEQTRSILLEAAAAWRPVNVTEDLKRNKRRKKRQSSPPTVATTAFPVVHPEALQVLDRLHRRFRTDAAAPGRPLAFFHAVMSELGLEQTLDSQTVIEAFGRQTGLPSFLIDDSVRPDLASIQQQLTSQVIGQEAVIETLIDLIAILATDLSRGDRPLASMMLIGPTGVGKTETAKALARLIYSDVSRLVRIDMSELSSPGAVGRLIGDAIHPEGLLTSAVRAQPFSLVLLDEFEKAHPSVFDLLLQILGEGRLTDGRGRLADFRNSIVMMTSNLGVDTFRATPLGLADTQQQQRYHNHFQRQLRDFLRPEMFNRIDRVLTYNPLSQESVQKIAALRIEELKRRDGWQSYGNELQIDESALELISKAGFQPQYGARPLTRELERSVVVPLSEAICNSGRSKKLDVKVTRRHVDNPDEEQGTKKSVVLVIAKAIPDKQKRGTSAVDSLMNEVTRLRRRGQSLDRCDAVRKLRNHYTMATRKMKALLRSAKNDQQRDRIRHGSLELDRIQTRTRMTNVRDLCRQTDALEAKWLAKFYRGETIDIQVATEEMDLICRSLWDTLCDLQSGSSKDDQRVTLVLTTPDFLPAEFLLKAYRKLAQSRNWTLQAHALLPRHPDELEDRTIASPGWSEEPAFRVSTTQAKFNSDLNQLAGQHLIRPQLAAYRLLRFDALTAMPSGTLGLMLTFRGKNAGLMMGGEVGVHTFNQLQKAKSPGHSLLIAKHYGMPIDYLAPEWLAQRSFELSGHPRRWYDQDNQLAHDMSDSDSRPFKMDREGRWLETLVEQETERRIWAELDGDDWDKYGSEADLLGSTVIIN